MFRSFTLMVASALLVGLHSEARGADPTALRVAAWNIANLHHKENVEARPGIGTRRTTADFETLRDYAREVDADVVVLQEIGTKKGAERIFPVADYEIRMSGRYDANVASGIETGIYTAIGVRKRDDIAIVKQDDLEELSIVHEGRRTRSGTALLLNISGTKIWVLSVHLKSSCATTRSADTSSQSDCRTFWKQRVPLKEWIDERIAEGTPFIIAGDFNRRFRQFGDAGPFWTYINAGDLEEPRLDKHPEQVTRKCPTRKGKSTQPIDWILLDADIAYWFKPRTYWETRFRRSDVEAHGGADSQRLSDHCPIHIDLEW